TWWPGLEEVPAVELDGGPARRPRLVVPPGSDRDVLWWTHRDREEEIIAVARQLKTQRRNGEGLPLDRTAVVYKAPLPYLYVAAEVFGAAGIPFQTADTLPLAAEPPAAALDLVLDAVESNFTRDAVVALLRSPHFVFRHDDGEVSRESTSALDRALSS